MMQDVPELSELGAGPRGRQREMERKQIRFERDERTVSSTSINPREWKALSSVTPLRRIKEQTRAGERLGLRYVCGRFSVGFEHLRDWMMHRFGSGSCLPTGLLASWRTQSVLYRPPRHQHGLGSTLHSPTRTQVDSGSENESLSPQTTFKQKLHRFKRVSRSAGRGREDGMGGAVEKELKMGEKPTVLHGAHLALSCEDEFDPAPFAFKPLQLASLVDPKNVEALESMGGVTGLLRGLGTHRTRGLGAGAVGIGVGVDMPNPDIKLTGPGDEVQGLSTLHSPGSDVPPVSQPSDDAYIASAEKRRGIFGPNIIPARPGKSLLYLMAIVFKDKVLILLSIAAVVSLALGFFQDFGPARDPDQPPVDWVEGVAIVVAILIIVIVGSLNDYQKERQFQVLNAKKEERSIKVIRNGVEHLINVNDVVVGDVALLEPGEIVPCDGVFLSGHNVRCDESGATGESDAIKKLSYEDCIALRDVKLAGGDAKGLTTLDADGLLKRPTAMDLLGHTDCFIVSGSKVIEGVGTYVVVAVGTKSFHGRIMMSLRGEDEVTPLQSKLGKLAQDIATAGSIAGLLVFIVLLIRFFVQLHDDDRSASRKGIAVVNMLIVAVSLVVVAVPEGLPLAVTLALAFATKQMTKENLLVRVLASCEIMANATVVCTDKTGTLTQNEMTVVAGAIGVYAKFVRGNDHGRHNVGGKTDFALELTELDNVLTPALRVLFNEAIAVNSTAFEDKDHGSGATVFIGNKTETALLKMAKELGWPNYKATRDAATVLQMIPFSSERKAMGVVVGLPGGRARMYVKGASEILTEICTTRVKVYREDAEKAGGEVVETQAIGELDVDNISTTISFYASQMLRTIALCYREFESWPPPGARLSAEGEVEYEDLAHDLTLVGITGIEDPLRPGVREAVASCSTAGVRIKMCTGDNVLTARSIAQQCGIYTSGGIVMEGPVFRRLSTEVRRQIVPRLQVLARSSPEDKRVLVDTLKDLDEVVGVTGDGTNDGPALKTAHVGFSMGIAGTEVAKEASDIILMDDNFASIVKAIMWGRCVYDAVRKFLQFQISTNVTAVIITLVSAIASDKEEAVLSAVQLLWINIIMDTFAALALATDPASPALLERKPDTKWAPLFSVDMIKQIIGQSMYQTTIIIIFYFLGDRALGQDGYDRTVQTLVFNIFVFCQIFNSINARRLDRKLNVFEGILKNWYFIVITFIEVAGQILIVFVGGTAFQVTRIGGREWGMSLALGVVSIPLGALVRLVPSEPCERLFQLVRLIPKERSLPTTRSDESSAEGSRASSPSSKRNMLSVRLEPVMPPRTKPKMRADNEGSPPAEFWGNKFEVHPDTPKDDSIFKLLAAAATEG
ncbi:hypothetical protein OF83DRAFT_1153050, partial [Amylostereum chailletii]